MWLNLFLYKLIIVGSYSKLSFLIESPTLLCFYILTNINKNMVSNKNANSTFEGYANVKNDHGKKGIKANHAYLVSASVCWILKWISCWSICLRTFSTSKRAFCNSFKISTWDTYFDRNRDTDREYLYNRFGRKREKQLI